MRLRVAASVLACLFSAACSSASNDAPQTDGGTTDSGGETSTDAGSQDPLAVPCTDSPDSIYADPGPLPADKGAIIRCTRDAPLTKDALQATLTKDGYTGRPITSGAHVYRILYRTERAATPGYSSAIVYIPDTPRADKLPNIVLGHGSRGQAPACTPSKFLPAGAYVQGDFELLAYTIAGFGYVAIAPDNAGYANFDAANNPVPSYGSAEDVGKSMLDATRALQKLVPSMLQDKVVIVGHSQGGHSALSALAYSETYGAASPVAATAVYAPLWLPQRTWGAIIQLAGLFPFSDSPGANAVSLWYHYSHAELLDGPGHGLDVFAASKRDAIKKFFEGACWGDWAQLQAMGSDATDIYDPDFAAAIGNAAATTDGCPTDEPKKSLCEKWMARYEADRPALTGNAAKAPVLFMYGNADTTIPPERATCARDWLTSTGGNVTYCVLPDADHNGTLKTKGDYVADWIAAQTLGATAPEKCALGANDILDPSTKMPATCNPAPPNK